MKKSAFILLAITAIVAGCTKGPVGPPGNANVQTYFYQADSAEWGTSNNGLSWYTGLSVPEIDQGVINTGVVLVYWVDTTTTSTGTISYNYQVPFFDNGDSVNFSATISNYDATNNPNNITIFVSSTDGIPVLDPGVAEFRVVVIPSLDKMAPVVPKGWIPVATKVIK